jgi:hypothetical protein
MTFIYKWRKKWRFSHRVKLPLLGLVGGAALCERERVACRRACFTVLRLTYVLSRACLAKMIIFKV